jgi:hypothetical protein
LVSNFSFLSIFKFTVTAAHLVADTVVHLVAHMAVAEEVEDLTAALPQEDTVVPAAELDLTVAEVEEPTAAEEEEEPMVLEVGLEPVDSATPTSETV